MHILRRLFGVEYMLPAGYDAATCELPTSSSMYREFIRLAIPSVCEMVLISLINMMDTIMVSGLGTDAVAAVGLVDQPRMLMLCFFFALNVGITAVVARRKGEGRKEEANQVVRNMILIILGLSFVLMALALPFADPLMRFAGAEKGRTLEDATKYFLIVGAALPANALSMGICAAQRGIGNTKLTMYVNIISNLVNICFNYLLINGIGPFPRLGVIGAAIATAMGMVVGLILCLVSLFRGKGHDSFLQISLKDDWRIKKRSVMDVLRVSSSAMLEQIAMRIGFFSYAKIVAELGTDAFAAHQIAMKFLNLSFCFADGLGVAGTSLVGQMLGRGRKELSHIYGIIAQKFSLIVAIVIATCCVVFRSELVSLFIRSDAGQHVRELAEIVMMIVGAFQPFQMLAVVVSGALRGAGDVKYTAKIMLLTVSVMRPVLSLLAVYILNNRLGLGDLALMGCWSAALIDMIVRMILMLKRYRGGKWHDIKV